MFGTHSRRYFDALPALFCCQLGYSYAQQMATAAMGQMTKLAFATTWGFAHPPAVELAERLSTFAPPGLGHVFFTSGGSESDRRFDAEERERLLRGFPPGRLTQRA